MPGFIEGRYSEAQLERHRSQIISAAVVAIAAFAMLGLFTGWSAKNVIASSALVVVLAAALWWMFASRKAGPVRPSNASIAYGRSVHWWDPINPWRWATMEDEQNLDQRDGSEPEQ